MSQSNNNPPIEVIRDGAIKASIWKNESENGQYLTTTFARTYTDREGEPQDTGSFQGRDLLVLAELARRAYYWTGKNRPKNDTPQQEPY